MKSDCGKLGSKGERGSVWERKEDGRREEIEGMWAGLISGLFKVGHADYEAFSCAEQRPSIHKKVCTSQ